MKQLRLFHSQWTAPQNSDRWGFDKKTRNYVDLLCTAISVECAKQNGCYITLHTDNAGNKRYGWLPYDEVHTTLQAHQYDTSFWASGKIISQQYEPLGAIHIDTDVFVKTPRTVAMLSELAKNDLIVQHVEWNYQTNYNRYTWQTFVNILESIDVPGLPEFQLNPCHGYCCGVVGFNSQYLKELYVYGYKLIYETIANQPLFQLLKNDFCPDLMAEQGWLYSAAQAVGAKVKMVLQNNDKYDADSTDFVHIINTAKYEPDVIVKLEQFLQYINPELFSQVLERKNTF